MCVQGVKICRVWGAFASIGATFVLCEPLPPLLLFSLSLSVYANKGEVDGLTDRSSWSA